MKYGSVQVTIIDANFWYYNVSFRESSLEEPSIVVKFLVSIDRSKGVEMAKEITSLAIKYHKKHKDVVVGMDMSGNMRGSKARDFFDLLSEARAAGMKISIHAAEVLLSIICLYSNCLLIRFS